MKETRIVRMQLLDRVKAAEGVAANLEITVQRVRENIGLDGGELYKLAQEVDQELQTVQDRLTTYATDVPNKHELVRTIKWFTALQDMKSRIYRVQRWARIHATILEELMNLRKGEMLD